LTWLRQVRAARIRVAAVLADAECGDGSRLRDYLHRAGLPYAVGVSSTITVFRGTPRVRAPQPIRRGRPRIRPSLPVGVTPIAAAARVTPAHAWRQRRLPPEVWLLAEQDAGTTPRTKYYLIDMPATTSLGALVQLAHQRWAIEQQYQELKDELGLDHFEGRSLPGWERHLALTALAYTLPQVERQRPASRPLTLPHVRAIIREVLTAHFFVTRPHYLKRVLTLQDVALRI
jgi:SRSO17 transposase